jgi:hypothetical protein
VVRMSNCKALLDVFAVGMFTILSVKEACAQVGHIDLPDTELVAAYDSAAAKNVLAAVNPKVFPGYWSVCADGKGFGYGNSYPSDRKSVV